MTKILTVEDSRAMRAVILKALGSKGYDLIEAENGEEGLAVLCEGPVDLILLDITMPVMDGPTMLKNLRSQGDRTPVILLTAESKTGIIGDIMRDGVDDYILKPFKGDTLVAKVQRILGSARNQAPAAANTSDSGEQSFVDVLVVDDMENVAKRLKRMLPDHLGVAGATDAQSALARCKESIFRVVMVDTEIPDVETASLVSQLRTLQPNAVFMALVLRTAENATALAKDAGCAGHLVKPFDPDQLDDFLYRYFEQHDVVAAEDNVLTVSARAGRANQLDKHYRQILEIVNQQAETLAAASFESVILDLSLAEDSKRLVHLIIKAAGHAENLGLQLRVVVAGNAAQGLADIKETEHVPVYPELSEALAAEQ
jgi:DNA-binding response OmpR family regulator